MSRRRAEFPFEEWVEITFGASLTVSSAQRPAEARRWSGPPAVALDHLTRSFEKAAEVLAPYSDAQLADVFWRRLSFAPLVDGRVPMVQRRRCVRSIYTLFEQCFALRCEPHLSHLDRMETQVNPLNGICYMWWDIRPMTQPLNPAEAELTAEYLDVMRRTLLLDSVACQESALHGLGHGHWDFGHWREEGDSLYGTATEVEETVAIIDDFLARNPELDPALRRYALAAREGRIQ